MNNSNPTLQKLIKFFVPFVILSGALILYVNRYDKDDYFKNYLHPMEIQGEIIEKFRDKNHQYRKLKIRESGKEKVIHVSYDFKEFYEIVEPGDSIDKNSYSNQVKIFRNDESFRMIEFNLDEK